MDVSWTNEIFTNETLLEPAASHLDNARNDALVILRTMNHGGTVRRSHASIVNSLAQALITDAETAIEYSRLMMVFIRAFKRYVDYANEKLSRYEGYPGTHWNPEMASRRAKRHYDVWVSRYRVWENETTQRVKMCKKQQEEMERLTELINTATDPEPFRARCWELSLKIAENIRELEDDVKDHRIGIEKLTVDVRTLIAKANLRGENQPDGL